MAVHTVTCDSGYSRFTEGVSSYSVGDESSTLLEVRFVINAATSFHAAKALANEEKGKTSYYGVIGSGDSVTFNVNNAGFTNNINRVDFFCIGSSEVFTLQSLDNFGKPLTDPADYTKVLKTMHTIRYPISDKKSSITLAVT